LMRQGKLEVSTMVASDIFIEEDKETGLLYAKARYYDADTGKFLSEDAWEGDNMIAPSLHRYLYGYQNPTVWVDPTGNAPEDRKIVKKDGSTHYRYDAPDLSEQRTNDRRAQRQASADAEVTTRRAQSVARDESARQKATAHVDRQKSQSEELNSQYNKSLDKHKGGQPISKWSFDNKLAKDAELVRESPGKVQSETNDEFVKRHLGSGSGRTHSRALNQKGVEIAKNGEQFLDSFSPTNVENLAGPIIKVAATGVAVYKGGKLIAQSGKADEVVDGTKKLGDYSIAGKQRGAITVKAGGRYASALPVVARGSKEWNEAVKALSGSGKVKLNYRTATATDAKTLLRQARGSMDRRKNYAKDKGQTYRKGYEVHNVQNARELGAKNDLQHLNWKDGKSGGHIYYNNPN
jgi:RHS repeat-associated protein